jgi:hypothetical protein
MNHTTSTTPDVRTSACPARRIGLELPLATIEELDHLATLNHISRQETLRQIINAGLISDTPHWPTGPDPIDRLAAHAYLTHRRSLELASWTVEP